MVTTTLIKPEGVKSFPTRQRIDVKKAFMLRYLNGLSESEIARRFQVARQSVNKALKPFQAIIEQHDAGQAFRENKPIILDAVEMDLVSLLTDKSKRKKATLGNVAYALDKINNINRLERGLSTAIVERVDLTGEERDEIRRLEAMIIEGDTQDVVVEPVSPDSHVVSD